MDAEEELARARIGTAVGVWRLERLLGVGGMASVYAGRRGDGVLAAVKVLHPYWAEIGEIRSRFLLEGPIGSALALVAPLCRGLPQVFEAGSTPEGGAYLAMEFLDGQTLFDAINQYGVMLPANALRVAEVVLDVLVVAHSHGIIHRDIKPENIVLLKTREVKLLDFGVARLLGGLPDGMALPERVKTKTGTVIGSGNYMAPEQALGRVNEVDGRTDIYGLGATLFHALSGRPLHAGLSDAALLIAAATQEAPSLASSGVKVPSLVISVVDRCLRKAKENRYQDVASLRRDLQLIRLAENL